MKSLDGFRPRLVNRKQFAKAGWKEKDDATVEDMAGTIAFTRENQDLSILYVDNGIMPAEITISATGVELE